MTDPGLINDMENATIARYMAENHPGEEFKLSHFDPAPLAGTRALRVERLLVAAENLAVAKADLEAAKARQGAVIEWAKMIAGVLAMVLLVIAMLASR